MTTHFNAGHFGSTSTQPAISVVTSPTFGAISDIEFNVKKGVGRVSENTHILANEPSLALHCLQEHIRKELPNVIRERQKLSSQNQLLLGTLYDCDYAIGAVKSIEKCESQFNSIQDLLKNALYYKQQHQIFETRRKMAARSK